MDQGTLVSERIEAAGRFLEEFAKTTPVVVAYWVEEDEGRPWTLFIASDPMEAKNIQMNYREVMRISQELNDPNFDPFRVTLVGLDDPMAGAVLEIYKGHSAKIPLRLRGRTVGDVYIEDAYLVRGPTGDYAMPSGREMLNQIIDQEANFFQQHGKPPRKMKLPVLMAYDLAKCGRNEVGDLSGKVFKDGITVFEKEGFHGMTVEIVRDWNATLEFE